MKEPSEKQIKANIEVLIATLEKVSAVSEKSLYATNWGAHTQEDRQFAVAIGCARALHHIGEMKKSATKAGNIIKEVCWDHFRLGDFGDALDVFDLLEDALHAKIESFGLSEDKKQQLRDVASANEKLSTAHSLISEAHPTLAENEMRENPLMRSEMECKSLDGKKIDYLYEIQIKIEQLKTARAVNNAKHKKRSEVHKLFRNWRNIKALEIEGTQPPTSSEDVLAHAVEFCLNSVDPRCAEILLKALKSEIERGLSDAEGVKNAIVELTLFLRKKKEESDKMSSENKFLRNLDSLMFSKETTGEEWIQFIPFDCDPEPFKEMIETEEALKRLVSFCIRNKDANNAKHLLVELERSLKNPEKKRFCTWTDDIKKAIEDLSCFLKQGDASGEHPPDSA